MPASNLGKPLPTLDTEVMVCPNCSSRDVEIENYYNNFYPFHRCLTCSIGFYKSAILHFCKYHKKALTRKDCNACLVSPFINQNVPCTYWGGILEPPPEIRKALKEKMKKKTLIDYSSIVSRVIP